MTRLALVLMGVVMGACTSAHATGIISALGNERYGISGTCAGSCHSVTPSVSGVYDGTESIWNFEWASDLAAITPDASNNTEAAINALMDQLDAGLSSASTEAYAPEITSIGGVSAEPGDAVDLPAVSSFTSDINAPFQIGVTFDAGRAKEGNTRPFPSGLTTNAVTGTGTAFSSTSGANQFTALTIALTAEELGDLRRAGTGLVLSFSPVNDGGFRFVSVSGTEPSAVYTTDASANRISLFFDNIPPEAEDAGAPVEVDGTDTDEGLVLSGDVTPGLDAGGADLDGTITGITAGALSGGAGDLGTLSAISADGSFTYTPPSPLPAAATQVTFTFTLTDDDGESDTATFTLSVPAASTNQPPVAVADGFDVVEDTETGELDFLANDADPDSDPLTGRITTFPRFGCVRLFDSGGTQLGGDCNPTVDFAEGTVFVYEPDENATGDPSGTDGFGTDTFIYEITDGTATSAAIVTLTIEAVDDDPVVVAAVAAPPVSDRSGTVEINLLSDANVTDPDGDELTVTEVVLTSLDSPLDLTTIPFSEADGVLSFEASDLNGLDDGESAALLFTYTVSDGSDPTVENVAAITVSGSDNGVIGNPGQYANTLSGRYNGHFGTQNDANASCHTCHEPGNVNADLDTLADCTATGPNGLPLLTAYGRDICLGRPEGAEPLSDLLRRLEVVEADYAPILADPGPLTISELDAIDTEIARLTTSQAGQTITGATADIIDYRFAEPGNDAALRSRRLSPGNGFFRVGETGVLTLAERPAPGVYTLDIRPVNDAKQRDNEGADRDGIAGFFPVRTAQLTVVTITVLSEAVTAVDDTATTVSNAAVVVDVLANDTGGTATVVTLGDAPANGAAEVASEFPFAITYTPDATFTGTDTFTYVATNDANAPSTGTVTVTVLPAGALVAVDDAVSVASGVTTLIDVLGNDVNAIAAGEDGATVVTLEGELSPGEAGTVTLNGQELEFAAAEGFTGTATLQYAATNPNVAGDTGTTATVTLSVQAFGSGVISDAVDDPELSRVAVALEDTCAAVDPGASAEAAAFVAACSGLAAAAGAGDDLTQAMEALRNEEHFAAVDATMTMARGLGQTLGRRLDRVQSGGLRGVDLSGITMTLGEVTLPAELAEAASAALGARNTDGEGPGDIGMFVAGDITIATRDGDGTAASYDVYAGNLMIGVDRRFAGDLTLGLALGGTGSVTDFSDGGELVGRGLQFAIYGYRDNFGAPNVSLSGYAAVGYTQFDSERRIVFTSGGADVDETADASFDGYYLNIAPTLAVTRTLGEGRALADPLTDVEVRLYTTLDYLYTYIGEYTETGGGGFDLAVEAESYHSLVGSIGVDASRPLYPSPNIRMEVFGGVALNGEFLDGDRSVTSSFAIGGPGAPTFVATEDGSSFLSGSGEIGAAFGFGRSTLEFGYGIDYGGPSSLTTHRLGLGFATSFLKQDRLGVSVRRSASADGGGWGTELDYGIRF